MTDNISLVGVVATPPKSMQTNSGLSIVSFRLASSQRRYDRVRNLWVDADTNWYTVTAFRQLADNAAASLSKGDRVVVSGRLRVRTWENGERSGTSVEVDADALGPDLLFGTTTFTRVASRTAEAGAQDHEAVAPEEPSEGAAPGLGGAVTPSLAGAAAPGLPGAASPGLDEGAAPRADPAATDAQGELVGAVQTAPQWHPAVDEAPF